MAKSVILRSNRVLISALLFVGVGGLSVLSARPSLAQHSEPEAAVAVDSEAYGLLEASAEKLGMVRGVGRSWKSINRISYEASGRIKQQAKWRPIAHQRVELNYAQSATRLDRTITAANGAGARRIVAHKGEQRWIESTPGVITGNDIAPTPSESAAWRLLATPHGALRAALAAETNAAGAVSVRRVRSTRAMRFESQGVEVVLHLNSEKLPTKVELSGIESCKMLKVAFKDYKDWELLDVLFPAQLDYRCDGKLTVQETVQQFRTNPYVIFVPPTQ